MRNIAEIIEDDRNGKQLSQTERQIAVAYIQGKYDAVRELKIDNASNANEVLDKIRAEIDIARYIDKDTKLCKNANASGLEVAMQIIDKYKADKEQEDGKNVR